MELKKKLLAFITLLFTSSILFGNEWLEHGKSILAKKNEPQVLFWIDFLEKNTSNNFIENEYGERMYKIENFTIIENGSNDDGRFSKNRIGSHTYSVYTQDMNLLRIIITQNEVRMIMGTNKNLIYWIIVKDDSVEYHYFDYPSVIQIK